MKTEELMIGDWVIAEGKQTRVTDIDEYDGINRSWIAGCEDGGCVHKEDIKPIRLTKKILEKNSFLEVKAIEYPSYSIGISFLYKDTIEGLRIFVQNTCAGEPTCTIIKTCKYVHELQHVLKLCKIEKEIVL